MDPHSFFVYVCARASKPACVRASSSRLPTFPAFSTNPCQFVLTLIFTIHPPTPHFPPHFAIFVTKLHPRCPRVRFAAPVVRYPCYKLFTAKPRMTIPPVFAPTTYEMYICVYVCVMQICVHVCDVHVCVCVCYVRVCVVCVCRVCVSRHVCDEVYESERMCMRVRGGAKAARGYHAEGTGGARGAGCTG